MDMEFRFNIGELVVMRVSVAAARLNGAIPHIFSVIERSLTENSGGISYEYYLSALGLNESCDEVELISLQDYEAGKEGKFK